MSSTKEVPKEVGSNGDSPQALKSWWATFKKGKRKAVPAGEPYPRPEVPSDVLILLQLKRSPLREYLAFR
jgi:hypothetical protein